MSSFSDLRLAYDRSTVTPGILHFGVGQFCRGHLFRYTQRVLELPDQGGTGNPKSWGIIGVNTIAGQREKQMFEDFKKQKCLYTVSLFPSQGKHTVELVGSMIDYIYAPEEQQKLLSVLLDERIRIVSLTVTEGGYNIDERTDAFDAANPAVVADLANARRPTTVFGYIVEGLRQRREKHMRPFTIMSCDNLRHNGDVARKAILGYAAATGDAQLVQWIEAEVCFPNSMVDRITPATTEATKRRLNALNNTTDQLPVIGEDFSQWVMEDKFVDHVRPPWERVGLELSEDVPGFENTKIRILNSSHLMITFAGLLLGYRTVHEALADADIYQLTAASLNEDVLPTLTSPMDKNKYKDTILQRFANPAIADQLLRIAGDGCSKVQVFWTNNIVAVLKRKEGYANFAFGIACFIEYLRGKDVRGDSFPVVEPKLDAGWQSLVADGADMAAPLRLNAFDAWRGMDHAALDAEVIKYRTLIQKKGVRAAMPFKASGSECNKAHL